MFSDFLQNLTTGPMLTAVLAGAIDYGVSTYTGNRVGVEPAVLLGRFQVPYHIFTALAVGQSRFAASFMEQLIEEFLPLNARAKAIEGAFLGPLGTGAIVSIVVLSSQVLPAQILKLPPSASPIREGFMALASSSVANQMVKVFIPAITGQEILGVN